MEIKNAKDARDSLKKLLSTEKLIEDAFYSDYGVSGDDWTALLQIKEKLDGFYDLLLTEIIISQLISQMICSAFRSEEARFNVQGTIKSYYESIILSRIESIIEVCKTWKFDDYRAVNFEKEVIEVMEPMIDFFTVNAP